MHYNKAIKHLSKITDNARKKYSGRPALRGVLHNGNNIEATDSHRLLKVKVNKMDFEKHILDLKEDEEIQAEFPDTEKIIPTDSDITISVGSVEIVEIKKLLKYFKTIGIESVDIVSDKGTWSIQPKFKEENNLQFKYLLPIVDKDDTEKNGVSKRILDLTYLINAFEFLEETKQDIKLYLQGNTMYPINFKGKDFDYIIVPIRERR